jgi:hypothetical protein
MCSPYATIVACSQVSVLDKVFQYSVTGTELHLKACKLNDNGETVIVSLISETVA